MIRVFYFQISCIFYMVIFLTASAQRPNGTWRDHLPYKHGLRVAEVGNKIFCSTDGGLFSFNKDDNYCCQKYSKVTGLHDVEISAIDYSETNNTFVIGYLNGNVDLIRDDSIKNIPDIKRKIISGEKKINTILSIGDIAYLATGFGIVAIDVNKKEVKDTYQFGEEGSQIKVNDLAFEGANIYAATDKGIYMADINSPNLVDYNYWSKITSLPLPDFEYRFIAYYNNKLFACYRNPSKTYDDDIVIVEDGNWSLWSKDFPGYYYYFGRHNEHLIAVTWSYCNVYNQSEELIENYNSVGLKHGIYDEDHVLWVAHNNLGLIKYNSEVYEEIAPPGPADKDVGSMLVENGHLWAGTGNESNKYLGKGIYSYFNDIWISYNKDLIPELANVWSIREIAVDPTNPEHVYGGSYGCGVAELKDGGLVEIYNEYDGLRDIEGFEHKNTIRVNGMSYDKNNNLWIATSEVENPVYVLRSGNKKWENLNLSNDIFGINTRTGKILATSFNQVWLLLQRYGVFVFRENSDGSISEKLLTIKNQEGHLIDLVYSIAEDLDGNIWIGSNKGPVVYYRPTNIFSDDDIFGYQIKIPRNDESGLADFLLENEKINAIAVDGANRKWLGTQNSGAFLMSEDGKEEILSFNEEDDPLFSNTIISIAVNNDNGEIFFGTEKGILSFMGQATAGNDDFKNVYAYPNPVREGYEGDITITGLVTDANVKITDVSGNIVFETTALGGQAIWDGKNFSGNRVHTGVYLIFCASEDGDKTHVTKLLFIH